MTTRGEVLVGVAGFLDALVTNDPSCVPVVDEVRCTANGVVGALGASPLWGRVARIPARQTIVDASTATAVFFGVLSASTSRHASVVKRDWFYAVRLRFDGPRIAEVEEVSFEGTWAHYATDPSTVEMDPRFESPVPVQERTSRADMAAAVRAYCEAVARTGPASAIPFHPDARRTELGQVTTDAWNFPLTARGDFGNDGWTWRVSNVRIPVMDVARGVAVAIFALSIEVASNEDFSPCVVVEAFKFEDSLIKRMFAVYHAGSDVDGWGSGGAA